MKKQTLKVPVRNNLTEQDLQQLAKHSANKIKDYIQNGNKKDSAFKFYTVDVLIKNKITTKQFLEFRHVCMKCGDVQDMGAYAIAQTSQGYKVNYTCECGHITVLPQL